MDWSWENQSAPHPSAQHQDPQARAERAGTFPKQVLPWVLKKVSWGCSSATTISSPLFHILVAETIHNDVWVDPAVQHTLLANSWCFLALHINHIPDERITPHCRCREPANLIFCLFWPLCWSQLPIYALQSHAGSTCGTLLDLSPSKSCTLLEINSTARLGWVKEDYCYFALSYFLAFQRQSHSDKWNSTSNGELLAAKLWTLVPVIVHSSNIYMTNKKNLWQKNLSYTCLALSLSSQFYLAFNHIALHLPFSSQSTKIA